MPTPLVGRELSRAKLRNPIPASSSDKRALKIMVLSKKPKVFGAHFFMKKSGRILSLRCLFLK